MTSGLVPLLHSSWIEGSLIGAGPCTGVDIASGTDGCFWLDRSGVGNGPRVGEPVAS